MPKVSVIIPVYNVEKYLPECLDSLINQTLKEIEIICVDDGSTDKSLDILNTYKQIDPRITVLTQKNLHAGVARNTGLRAATGEYLSFLDSDDIFESTMLEEMYNTAIRDNSSTVVCGFCICNSETKKITRQKPIAEKYVKLSPFSPIKIKDEIFAFSSPNAWTKLFKRGMFLAHNLQFIDTVCCNDFTCAYSALAVSNKISIINKPFIHYRHIQKTNLTAGRSNSPDSFLIAAQTLENNLKKFGLYNIYKKAFVTRMRSSFDWESSLCTQQQRLEREMLAKKLLSDDLFKILYEREKNTNNSANCSSTRPFRYLQ